MKKRTFIESIARDRGQLTLSVPGAPEAAPRGPRARLSAVAFAGLCALVTLAPLPLGSGRPLAWDLIGLATAGLLIVSAVAGVSQGDLPWRSLLGPLLLFLAAIAWGVVQIGGWTPGAWHNGLWELVSEGLGASPAGTIAVDRTAALAHLLRLLSYAGVFYLAVLLCRDAGRVQAARKAVMLSGAGYALYGLVAYWGGNGTILWLAKWAYRDDLTGPFVNRNSFATYLGLCLLASLCHVIDSFERLRPVGGWRSRLLALATYASARIWMFVALFFLATALVLTHSRGGFLSTLAGILAFLLAISQAPSLRRYRRVGIAALPLLLVILGVAISGGATVERMVGSDIDTDSRFAIYRLTAQAIADHPWLGTGLGSFAAVFRLYQTESLPGYYDLAHNDYLQNLLEFGIPAALALFAALLWLVVLCLRGVRLRRRDALYPCLGIGATSLVGLHSLFDFSLQIPAVTVIYMFILGMAVAQSRSTRERAQAASTSSG